MKLQNKSLFCDSCDFIFDQKWNNLSLFDLVLADKVDLFKSQEDHKW